MLKLLNTGAVILQGKRTQKYNRMSHIIPQAITLETVFVKITGRISSVYTAKTRTRQAGMSTSHITVPGCEF